MKLSYSEDVHKMWNDILVIEKTIERDNKKYHIVGMTLGDEAKEGIESDNQGLAEYVNVNLLEGKNMDNFDNRVNELLEKSCYVV